MQFPNGPTPQQTDQDRLLTGVGVIDRLTQEKRLMLSSLSLQRAAKTKRWSELEFEAALARLVVEIEALETARNTMVAALSVPRLQVEALSRRLVRG